MADDDWVFSLEYILGVPSLEALAMGKIVQCLWRHKIIEKRQQGELHTIYDEDDSPTILDLKYRSIKILWKVNYVSEKESLSNSLYAIQFAMQRYASFLMFECKLWEEDFLRVTFLNCWDQRNTILDRFDDFVYDYEGCIDIDLSVENILACDRFSIVEKYAIACCYRCQSYIDRLWPSVLRLVNFRSVSIAEYYLIYLWTNYMNRQNQRE